MWNQAGAYDRKRIGAADDRPQSRGSDQRLLRGLNVTVIGPNFSTNLTIRDIRYPPFCFVWNARAMYPGFPFEARVLQPETRPIPSPQKAH